MKNPFTISPDLWRRVRGMEHSSGVVYLSALMLINDDEEVTSQRLVDRSGYSIETVKRALKYLLKHGILTAEKRRVQGRLAGVFYQLRGGGNG